MRRRRVVPALISTIALIAGCGSESRVEVSGVVRDRATGRAIGGARVVATDGSATRTDAAGRFTLSVSRGRPGDVRASAFAHADLAEGLSVSDDAATEIELALLRLDQRSDVGSDRAFASDDEEDPDAVARFVEETWVDDAIRWARARGEDGVDDEHTENAERSEARAVRAAIALLEGGAAFGGVHREATCADCHATPSRSLRDGLESDLDARSCAACHGAERPSTFGGLRDRDGDGIAGTVRDEVERAIRRARDAVLRARTRIERCGTRACDPVALDFQSAEAGLVLLESDRSRGAHDAAYSIALALSIESSALAH